MLKFHILQENDLNIHQAEMSWGRQLNTARIYVK
jgi:hypothetical protein